MRKVVVNTTPLIALAGIGRLELLHHGFFVDEKTKELVLMYVGEI